MKLSAKLASVSRAAVAASLVVVLAVPPALAQDQPTAASPATQNNLQILALAGNQGQNDIERHITSPLVVQVLDQNQRPVAGADVVFRFPLNGPSARFSTGQSSHTVKTNSQGQAAARGWTPNDQVGTFQVQATATQGNRMGTATIPMSNVTRIIAGQEGGKKRRWSPWLTVAIVAGAAAAVTGIVLATTGDNNGNNGGTITISPGSPTIGGPK